MSSNIRRFSSAAIIAASACAISIGSLGAAPPDGPVPRLPWLHEGLALTYTWYAAQTAGNGSYYEENENGDFILHSTGQRFIRNQQRGTSGSGWTQYVIACIEGDKVVIASQSFGDAGSLGRNAPVPQGSASSVGAVLDPGDYWMDPANLASLHTMASANTLVQHLAWRTANGATDAIRVQIIHGTSYSDHVYDAKTGLVIHEASSSEGPPPKLVGPGDFGRGDTTLTRNEFVGMRDLSIPWAGEPMPEWATTVGALHYRGSMTSHGSLPTIPNVLSLDLQPVTHGRSWIEFSVTSAQRTQGAPDTPPGHADLVFGRSEFGGLWAGPAALGHLRQGQVLDEDPVTKMRTVVSRVDNSSVVIASANAAGEIDNQYDLRTGMLIASSFFDVLTMQQRTYKLQNRE